MTMAALPTTDALSAGDPGATIAIAVSRSTTIASNTRSTTSDASEVENEIWGTSRVRANARAGSPARAGATLFTIMPIAVDRQSGPNGSFGATGSRIVRHRRA